MNNLDKIREIVPNLITHKKEHFTSSDYKVFNEIGKDVLILVRCKNLKSKYLYFYDYKEQYFYNIGLLTENRISELLESKHGASANKVIKHIFNFVSVMNIKSVRDKKVKPLPSERIAIFRSDIKSDEIYTLCYILGFENKSGCKLARIKVIHQDKPPQEMTVNNDRLFKYTLGNIPLLTETWT